MTGLRINAWRGEESPSCENTLGNDLAAELILRQVPKNGRLNEQLGGPCSADRTFRSDKNRGAFKAVATLHLSTRGSPERRRGTFNAVASLRVGTGGRTFRSD